MKVLALLLAIAGCCVAIPQYAKMTRPPAFPLAVRNPYASMWLCRDELPGGWPCFWTGRSKGWTGLIRVDDVTYTYMGNPSTPDKKPLAMLATQSWTAITPTQTHFGLKAGPVDLNVTFFSPVEYEDIMKQSIPLSYVFVDVASNDGSSHSVQLYMDISGEMAARDVSQIIRWSSSQTPAGLKVLSTELQNQIKFGEYEDYPAWGQAILATSGSASHKTGSDIEVRTTFVENGALDNTDDTNFRCASCDWPTFGFAEDLGQVSSGGARSQYIVGHIREENANFLGTDQKALWVDYWPTSGALIDFFAVDATKALETADALDERILNEAFAAGGQSYADILSLSLRQSFATNEFSGNKTNPAYYQKEISSGGFMQTVDVIYPAAPMFYYLNVQYLKLLLDPLFFQMENNVWTKPFAMHDIGNRFPNATGNGYGGDMPIEESGNMIMMVGNIVFHPDANMDEAKAYASLHYDIMSQWADYLYNNCLYPVDQLSTDDFIGNTELNSGLALKGILAMATFAKISELVGNATNAEFYTKAVEEFVPIWISESMHMDKTHLKMEYNVTNGYQFKYNAYHDQLFGLNVVPQEIYDLEAAYYLTKMEPYGIPFVSTHDYTKSDWEIWTAAAFGDSSPELKTELIESLGRFLRFTAQRVPFIDWYVTATANYVGFKARPVVGGHFAILALEKARNARRV
jgi:hypothetical protein